MRGPRHPIGSPLHARQKLSVLSKVQQYRRQKEDRDNLLAQMKDLKERQRQQDAVVRDMKRQRHFQMQKQKAAMQKLERDREKEQLAFAQRERRLQMQAKRLEGSRNTPRATLAAKKSSYSLSRDSRPVRTYNSRNSVRAQHATAPKRTGN